MGSVDASVFALPPAPGEQRLPLLTRSRNADRSSLREADGFGDVADAAVVHADRVAVRDERIALPADTAASFDRRLHRLSGRAARCRLVEGWLAAGLLSRRSWFPLGFVRLGDYTSERLGIGARIFEEEARIAVSLQRLPRITAAFLDGSLTWTAVRLVAGVATARDESRWLEQARTLDTRSLAALVRTGRVPKTETANVDTADPAAASFAVSNQAGANPAAANATAAVPGVTNLRASEADDEDDPMQRWEVRVSHGGRRLWRAACEMAQRTAGTRLTPAQVLEQVAAEAASGGMAAMAREWNREPSRGWIDEVSSAGPQPGGTESCASGASSLAPVAASLFAGEASLAAAASSSASGHTSSMPGDVSPTSVGTSPTAAVPVGRQNLVELLAAEIERTADAPGTNRLPFLTLEGAGELEERDLLMAAFYAELLSGDGTPVEASDEEADIVPPPEPGWFEATLRRIGEAEGFGWLTKLHHVRPTGPVEWLEAELDSLEAAEPHTIDARLREVRRVSQSLDFELAGLLRDVADRRIYREFGLANLEQDVETRLGIGARTAWILLAIERATRRCSLLGEAWRSGQVSALAARVLLPVIGGGHGREWIARAGMVTLRRLESEVT